MKWTTVIFVFITLQAFAQEQESNKNIIHNRFAITISHTHIPKAFQSTGSSDAVIVPSWGLNYEYWLTHKFAIGVHSDMEISTYIIEEGKGKVLERKRPVVVALVGIIKPWKGLEVITGFGREFEEHEKFWVFRMGLEYELEMGNNWDLAPGLIFDVKEDIYDSWTLGVSFGKKF